jgi:hypothetical protein
MLPALHTGHLYPPRKYSWYSILLEAELTKQHSTAVRMKLMKNSNDTIGNITHDLLAYSAVPQSTVLPGAQHL